MVQLDAFLASNEKIVGSNPTERTNYTPIAQLDRAPGFYPGGKGSNPFRRTILHAIVA